MSIVEKILSLKPGERIPYNVRRDGVEVYTLANRDCTVVLTQQKGAKVSRSGGQRHSYTYYANRISIGAADLLDGLSNGEDIGMCFWKSNIQFGERK